MTALLVVILGVQAARLVWILAVPPGGVGASGAAASAARSQADLSILSRFDAFFRGGPQGEVLVTAPGGEGGAQGAFNLYGVRATGGGSGSAIIAGPDGRQISVAVGESIAEGVTLVSVGADFAIIRRGGREERLEFAPAPPPSASAPQTLPTLPPPSNAAPTQAAAAATGVSDRSIVSAIGLQPRRVDGRVRGFVLIPRGDASGLAAAGLRPGDVILTVNGLEVTVENQAELLQDLRQAPQAAIGLERDGQPLTVTLGNPAS